MIPDTNVDRDIATISEVSDDQETTIFYTRVQTENCLSGPWPETEAFRRYLNLPP